MSLFFSQAARNSGAVSWFMTVLLRGFRLGGGNEILVDGGGGIAPVADRPDNEGGAAHDIASGEHAGQAGLEGAGIGLQRAPAGQRQMRLVERAGEILGIKTKGLNDDVGLHGE